MTVNDDPPLDFCAACSKPATNICSGCVPDSPNDTRVVERTCYCDTVCQKTDRAKHKDECRRRLAVRALYRAGDIARDVFYSLQETLYENRILGFKTEEDGTLTIILEKDVEDYSIFFPFPSSIMKEPIQRSAALALFACTEAVRYFRTLLQLMIGDVDLNHVPRATSFNWQRGDTIASRTTQEDFPHAILAVTFHSGETYAVDLSGAQYGIEKAVMPLQDYLMAYQMEIDETETRVFPNPLDFPFDHPVPQNACHNPIKRLFYDCQMSVVLEMHKEFKEQDGDHGSLAEMVKLPKAAFVKRKEAFLAGVRERISKAFADLHEENCGLLRFDGAASVAKEPERLNSQEDIMNDLALSMLVTRLAGGGEC